MNRLPRAERNEARPSDGREDQIDPHLKESDWRTLCWIVRYREKRGINPSIREVGAAFGIQHNAAKGRMLRLVRMGLLRQVAPRTARALSPTLSGLAAVERGKS